MNSPSTVSDAIESLYWCNDISSLSFAIYRVEQYHSWLTTLEEVEVEISKVRLALMLDTECPLGDNGE